MLSRRVNFNRSSSQYNQTAGGGRQLVVALSRRSVAVAIKRSHIPATALSHSLGTLSSVGDDNLREELQIVWELELDAASLLREVLQAFLDGVRWGIVSNADLRIFRAPFHGGIEIEQDQLDLFVFAVQSPRAKLLIADALARGKTIEAGRVMQEMVFRNRVRNLRLFRARLSLDRRPTLPRRSDLLVADE